MRIGYGSYLQSLLNYEEKKCAFFKNNKKYFDIFHSLYLKSNLCVHAFRFQKSKFTFNFEFNLISNFTLKLHPFGIFKNKIDRQT